jgi:hypothetical protein
MDTTDEFPRLMNGFLDLSRYRDLMIEEDAIVRMIPAIRLPERISVAIAERCAPTLFKAKVGIAHGNTRSDCHMTTNGRGAPDRWLLHRGEWRRLEIKGSGPTRFSSCTATDVITDYLIWVDFTRVLRDGDAEVEVLLFSGDVPRRAGAGAKLRLADIERHALNTSVFTLPSSCLARRAA